MSQLNHDKIVEIISEIAEDYIRPAGQSLRDGKVDPVTLETMEFIDNQSQWMRDCLINCVESLGKQVALASKDEGLKRLDSLKGLGGEAGALIGSFAEIVWELNQVIEVMGNIMPRARQLEEELQDQKGGTL